MNVFDAVPGDKPIIARQDACQTCFMCELYCPSHALYVAPLVGKLQNLTEEELISGNILGSYQSALGWKDAIPGGTENDTSSHMFEQIRIATFELEPDDQIASEAPDGSH